MVAGSFLVRRRCLVDRIVRVGEFESHNYIFWRGEEMYGNV